MAKRKVKRRRKSAVRHTTTSAPRRRHKKAPRRRRSTRRGLSEMFSPAGAQGAFRTTLSGMVGGMVGGALIDKVMPNQSETVKSATLLGASFLTSTLGRMPNVGAGMAGVAGYKLGQQIAGGLSDGLMLSNKYANDIERLPMFLNDDNQPMSLADGSMLCDRAGNPLQPAYSTSFGGM